MQSSNNRPKSCLTAETLNECADLREWQINEIKKGLSEANSGQLVGYEKVVQYWKKKFSNLGKDA